jgi:hypothetical protein
MMLVMPSKHTSIATSLRNNLWGTVSLIPVDNKIGTLAEPLDPSSCLSLTVFTTFTFFWGQFCETVSNEIYK